MKKVFFAFLLNMTLSFYAVATYYYVNCTTGNDAYDGLAEVWDGIHGPKKTIQACVNIATAGSIVRIAQGTYFGSGNRNISFGGKSMMLSGVGGVLLTIIDCGDSQRFCTISAAEGNVRLNSLRIINSYTAAS